MWAVPSQASCFRVTTVVVVYKVLYMTESPWVGALGTLLHAHTWLNVVSSLISERPWVGEDDVMRFKK